MYYYYYYYCIHLNVRPRCTHSAQVLRPPWAELITHRYTGRGNCEIVNKYNSCLWGKLLIPRLTGLYKFVVVPIPIPLSEMSPILPEMQYRVSASTQVYAPIKKYIKMIGTSTFQSSLSSDVKTFYWFGQFVHHSNMQVFGQHSWKKCFFGGCTVKIKFLYLPGQKQAAPLKVVKYQLVSKSFSLKMHFTHKVDECMGVTSSHTHTKRHT